MALKIKKPRKKKCRWCMDYFQPVNSLQVVCQPVPCAVRYAQKKRLDQQERAMKRKKREFRDNDFSHQLKLTQRKFNELVRLLDSDQPCISCGRFKCGHTWDAGHFISVVSAPELRFEFLNCYRQGSACNRGEEKHRTNAGTVRKRYEFYLTERMGAEVVSWLKGPHDAKNYTCDQLRQMRAMYSAEISYIEKYGKPSRQWRRLPIEEAA